MHPNSQQTGLTGFWQLADSARFWLFLGSLTCGLAVTLGAFGAHGLEGYFASKYAGDEPRDLAGHPIARSRKALRDYETGVRYQFVHGLGTLAVGILMLVAPGQPWRLAALLFTAGNLLFAGGLYLYTLTGMLIFGVGPPPIGGLCYIAGWIALCRAAWRVHKTVTPVD